MQQGPMRRRHQ